MAISGSALRSAIDLDRSDMVAPVTRADLAIGMQLLRASNMRALRLQLAVMRRDQHMVAETVDSLVELDSEIASFLADMPSADVAMREMAEISRWIDQQKGTIAAEKLALGCAVDGPELRHGRPAFGFGASTHPAKANDSDAEDADAALELKGYEVEAEARPQAETPSLAQTPPRVAEGGQRAAEGGIRLSPAELKQFAAEANGQQLRMAVAHLDKRLRRVPGRGFVFLTVLVVQTLIGAALLYGDALKPLLPVSF